MFERKIPYDRIDKMGYVQAVWKHQNSNFFSTERIWKGNLKKLKLNAKCEVLLDIYYSLATQTPKYASNIVAILMTCGCSSWKRRNSISIWIMNFWWVQSLRCASKIGRIHVHILLWFWLDLAGPNMQCTSLFTLQNGNWKRKKIKKIFVEQNFVWKILWFS